MGLRLLDGLGKNIFAGVNKQNRLMVESIVHSAIWEHAIKDGLAFSWASGTYDYAAADTILLVENTSNTHILFIEDVWLSGDTDTRVVIHVPTSDVTTAGTTITGVNLNGQSGIVAEANGVRDETGNTQGDVIWSGEIYATQNALKVPLYGAVTLAQNQSIGVDYVTDGTACDVTIFGYYVAKTDL